MTNIQVKVRAVFPMQDKKEAKANKQADQVGGTPAMTNKNKLKQKIQTQISQILLEPSRLYPKFLKEHKDLIDARN